MAYQNRVPKTFCTTREAAEILGVSLRTAQLWTESGLLKAWKTDGGHRRISRESIECLLVVPSRRSVSKACKSSKRPSNVIEARPFSLLVVGDPWWGSEITPPASSIRPRVTVVKDAYEALIRVGLERPDMVVVDLDGLSISESQMIQSIRAIPELIRMHIVIVTDQAIGDLADRNSLPSGIPVLPKPISFDQLYGLVEWSELTRG